MQALWPISEPSQTSQNKGERRIPENAQEEDADNLYAPRGGYSEMDMLEPLVGNAAAGQVQPGTLGQAVQQKPRLASLEQLAGSMKDQDPLQLIDSLRHTNSEAIALSPHQESEPSNQGGGGSGGEWAYSGGVVGA